MTAARRRVVWPALGARGAFGALGVPLLAGGGALLLYLATIAPGVTVDANSADSGELAAVASALGVAHPPGFALYLPLGWLALHALPFLDEPALRTNVLSAVLTATAVGVLAAAIRRWQPGAPWWVAAAGAAVAAIAPLVWASALITEVYALHALFAALALLLAPDAAAGRGWGRFGLALGLLGALHTTGWLLAVPLAVAAGVDARPGRAALLRAAAGGVVPTLASAVYLLLRADAPIAWGDTGTLAGLWRHLSGAQYRGLAEWAPAEIARALPASVREALRQVPLPLLPLLPLGALAGWRRRPALTAALLASVAALVALVTVYRAQGRETYLVPAALAGAMLLAAALENLSARLTATRWRRAAAAALGVTLVAWAAHVGLDVSMRGDRAAMDGARALLEAQAPHATLRTAADEATFPLWYEQRVRGVRPDVTIEDVRGQAPVLRGER